MPSPSPMSVMIKKDKLLSVLMANKEQHRSDYQKAMRNWRRDVAEEAKKVVAEASEGTLKEISPNHGRGARGGKRHPLLAAVFDEPSSHLDAYTTVIGMLEMCEDETISLNRDQFCCYVQDEWDWKRDWVFSNTKYL